MDRRQFLIGAASGIGAAVMSSTIGSIAWAATTGTRLIPWTSSTPTVSWKKTKNPPYRVALSNSYIGNTWRTEMAAAAKLYSERPDVKSLLQKFTISSAGNEVSAQIAQVNQMMLGGVDAIIMDAASPTGLNSTIARAVEAGIPVVSFDAVATAKQAVTANIDQFGMGKDWAEFVVKHMGTKGRVLTVRGVAGTFVDIQRTKGGKSVFDKYPGITTTEIFGKWDSGVAQKAAADALASAGATFNGVWCQGGDDGVVRAFLAAGKKIPPFAGESENGFRKQAAKYKFPMLSIGDPAGLSALSLMVALKMLQGEPVPRAIRVPGVKVTNEDLKEGVNYFDDLPDSMYMGISIPAYGLNFNPRTIRAAEKSI